MTFGPDGKTYYTIGDQGKNQLALACLNNMAQRLPTSSQIAAKNYSTYEGKVLRMNLYESIPDDNPELNGVKSHIYTYGHRNVQGIAVGPSGDLYVVEQGIILMMKSITFKRSETIDGNKCQATSTAKRISSTTGLPQKIVRN
jgi:glucose/arabinose dehydrogenase